ncbi:MAG: MDR family MFS transporter [Corynebacterium sp.]|nr:MDR family MFS transporter [Corynebacterium sp.]
MNKVRANEIAMVFIPLLLSMLMSSLGQMIFAAALPTIVGELSGVNHMSWVISAFMLTMTIAMPVSGKLGDIVGRKPVYLIGIVIFVCGSALGGFAHSMELLITGRGIQGFGAGILMISSQAIVAEVVPARQRGKYVGIMGSVFGVSSILGPVLGGWFTDGPGWRWGLWINIPIGIIAFITSVFVLRLRKGTLGQRSFDAAGFVGIAATTSALILMVTWGGSEYAWHSPIIVCLGLGTIAGAIITALIEARAAQPLIPIHLFQNRNMVLTTLAGIIVGLAMMGVVAYMPTYLQMVHELTPTKAGLMMIPLSMGFISVSTAVGFVIARTGRYKRYPLLGLAVMAVGLWLLAGLTVEHTLVGVGLRQLTFGIGIGLTMQVLVLVVQNSFPLAEVGTATAANNFFRQIGSALGASVVGSMFVHNLHTELSSRLPAALAALDPQQNSAATQFQQEGLNSLTPDLVSTLPSPLRMAVVESYNDALTPILALLVPLCVFACLMLLALREDSLRETVD